MDFTNLDMNSLYDRANKLKNSPFDLKSRTVLYNGANNSFKIRESLVPFGLLRFYVKIILSVVPFCKNHKGNLNVIIDQAQKAAVQLGSNKSHMDIGSLKGRAITRVDTQNSHAKVGDSNSTIERTIRNDADIPAASASVPAVTKSVEIIIRNDADNSINKEETKKAKKLLSNLINQKILWIASDQDRQNYATNFYDLMGSDLGEIEKDQLVAYKFEGEIHLTPITSLFASLKAANKFDIPSGDATKAVFEVTNGKAGFIDSKEIKFGICPLGTMSVSFREGEVDNHECNGQYVILYDIPPGKQGQEHPNKGVDYMFRGNPRECYLPANEEGKKALIKLIQAWEHRVTFSVGRSETTDRDNQVTWVIHHKTSASGHTLSEAPNYLMTLGTELYPYKIDNNSIKTMKFTDPDRKTKYGMKVHLEPEVLDDLQEAMMSITTEDENL